MRMHLTRSSIGGLLSAAMAMVALTGPTAEAVTKGAYATVSFDSTIAEVETGLDDLYDVLVEHTSLAGGSATRPERIVFAYGIGHGDDVFDVVVSKTVLITPGEKPFVSAASGPIDSPWDAFEDPALGFEDPALGFDHRVIDGDDPQASLEAIWGTGNVGIHPDDYGLVLFTMSDPDATRNGNFTPSVAVVPFEVR